MKKYENKLIDVIVEQTIQLEITRLKNKELTSLVHQLVEKLKRYEPTFIHK